MNVVKWMSVFWTVYGLAGVFGYQNIPAKFRGYSWTKSYIRSQGIAWLMLGIPYFIFSLVHSPEQRGLTWGAAIAILILGMPSFIYALLADRRYKALLKEDKEAASNEEHQN